MVPVRILGHDTFSRSIFNHKASYLYIPRKPICVSSTYAQWSVVLHTYVSVLPNILHRFSLKPCSWVVYGVVHCPLFAPGTKAFGPQCPGAYYIRHKVSQLGIASSMWRSSLIRTSVLMWWAARTIISVLIICCSLSIWASLGDLTVAVHLTNRPFRLVDCSSCWKPAVTIHRSLLSPLICSPLACVDPPRTVKMAEALGALLEASLDPRRNKEGKASKPLKRF